MTFEETFSALVVPHLRRMIKVFTIDVAWGRSDFDEAESVIWREAARRGATWLTPERQDQLEQWIAVSLMKAVDKEIPRADSFQAMLEAVPDPWRWHTWREDIARWERTWST